jgi:purine-binding chemotaxis protein CheW
MSRDAAQPLGMAAELRQSFDRSFAARPAVQAAQEEDLLAIRLGAGRYALRLPEIAGLASKKKIVRVPSRVPELLGVAGFRGAVMPVYDLSAILEARAGDAPHWFAVAAARPVVLAFTTFEGHLRVPRAAMTPRDGGQGRRDDAVVNTDGCVRTVIDVASILERFARK